MRHWYRPLKGNLSSDRESTAHLDTAKVVSIVYPGQAAPVRRPPLRRMEPALLDIEKAESIVWRELGARKHPISSRKRDRVQLDSGNPVSIASSAVSRRSIRVTRKNIFSNRKTPKYPKNPFFAIRPETASGRYYYFMLKLLLIHVSQQNQACGGEEYCCNPC